MCVCWLLTGDISIDRHAFIIDGQNKFIENFYTPVRERHTADKEFTWVSLRTIRHLIVASMLELPERCAGRAGCVCVFVCVCRAVA
jgi:hypothetical protein